MSNSQNLNGTSSSSSRPPSRRSSRNSLSSSSSSRNSIEIEHDEGEEILARPNGEQALTGQRARKPPNPLGLGDLDVDGTDELPPPPPASDVPPPPYQLELRVVPMTAEQSSRYDRGPLPTKDLPKHLSIPMALYTLTPPPMTKAPQGWIEFVHPEGQKYYYHPQKRIITDSNVKQPAVLQALARAMTILDTRLNSLNIVLPQTTEVTFEVDLEEQPNVVRYYYVDHAQKSQFWLEKTTTDDMQLPPVTSYTHLKHLFRQHYWTHIEFYPMHLTLSVEVEDELVAVLTHACVDYMTSTLSTVPYNQEQCEAYLRLIKGIPDSDRAEGYRNCVLARLWSEIDGNFFVNLRGEDNPRLSRIQRLLPDPKVGTTKIIKFIKGWLMLGSSGFYERILGEMWVDKISYASHWRKFMSGMLSEWKMHAIWTFVLLIVSAITFSISLTTNSFNHGWTAPVLQSMGLLSIVIALVGLGSSFSLLKMHRNQSEASASEAGDYLDKYFHKKLGHLPLSLIYAIPQASSLWSFLFLAMSVIAFILNLNSVIARVLVGALLLGILISIWFLTVCLDGKDDGTGSLVREQYTRARSQIPVRVNQIQRVTTQVARNIVGRRPSGPNTRNTNNGSNNQRSGSGGSNVEPPPPPIEPSSATNSNSSTGSQIVDVIPSGSQSNFGTVNTGTINSGYTPRRTSAAQNIAASLEQINHLAGNMYTSIISTLQNVTSGRHANYNRYQRVESVDTPLAGAFRSNRSSGDLERNIGRGGERWGSSSSLNQVPGSGERDNPR